MVEPRIRVLLPGKQRRQPPQVAPRGGEDRPEAPRPGHHVPHVPTQYAGLVGEEADDGAPEVLSELPQVGLVGQFYEPRHGLGVEYVGARRGVYLPVVLAEVYAPDGAAAWALHQKAPARVAQHVVPRQRALRQRDAPAGQLGMILHHQPAGRAGGIHALVVQHHPHVQRRRGLHGDPQAVEECRGQVGHARVHAHAGMEHHAVHAVVAEIPQLPAQLVGLQPVVQEPERYGRIRPRRIVQQLQQFQASFLP